MVGTALRRGEFRRILRLEDWEVNKEAGFVPKTEQNGVEEAGWPRSPRSISVPDPMSCFSTGVPQVSLQSRDLGCGWLTGRRCSSVTDFPRLPPYSSPIHASRLASLLWRWRFALPHFQLLSTPAISWQRTLPRFVAPGSRNHATPLPVCRPGLCCHARACSLAVERTASAAAYWALCARLTNPRCGQTPTISGRPVSMISMSGASASASRNCATCTAIR